MQLGFSSPTFYRYYYLQNLYCEVAIYMHVHSRLGIMQSYVQS